MKKILVVIAVVALMALTSVTTFVQTMNHLNVTAETETGFLIESYGQVWYVERGE